MSGSFVHLHCHSHYSLLDGASRIPDLIRHCKSLGQEACSITDHGNLYGMAEFLRVAKDEHFKPIVGMEAYVAGGDRTKKEGGRSDFHLTLLAKDGEGVRNLMRLSSRAFLEGYYYVPRIDKKILKEHSKGIICLSGCASAEFSKLLLEEDSKGAIELCQWYIDVFGDDFYVEIQENGVQIQRDCAVAAIDVAEKMGIPVVATSDAHYLRREDAPAHDVLLCINTGKTLDDPKRMRFDTDQFHVRSAEEMYESLSDFENVDEYIGLSGEIAEGVEDGYGSLDFGRRQFPSFAVPRGDADSYLAEVCRAGIAPRYGAATPEIEERLNHELGIISKMGFSSYFLIVWDFVDFARRNKIPVSARGSGCGALVAYLLGISNFCPLKHGLLFERFLDPNRSDPPDIDIDICKERRAEVVAYVVAKYGEDCVGKIGTFGTMAAKSVLKDVGRTLDIPIKTIEDLNKNISNKPNTKLADVVKGDDAKSKEFVRMVNADPALGRALGYATVLEGTARSAGVHAAGVVISPRPLADLVPMQRDKHGVVCTQWAMYDLEKAGMLKMDFLGLRNMTMLQACADMLGMESTDEFYRLPQDDPAVFRLMQRGQTDGVFQLDGDGIQELLVRVRPDRFDDVGAILALFRPGPLEGGMVDEYVDVKHGRKKANYIHPVMEEILSETYGVIVYQESIMKILNRLGGMELGQAYACIKAISKKKPDQVAKHRAAFEDGASRLIDRKTAEKIFDLITFFGSYGFNKSHAIAYAYIAWATAWVKAHHPRIFAAALLSSEMEGAERDKYFEEHVRDCRRRRIEILPPDINKSGCEFLREGPTTQEGGGAVRFGLSAIKGVGSELMRGVVAARGDRPFSGFRDFLARTAVQSDKAGILIKAGALDCLGETRPAMLAAVASYVKDEKNGRNDAARGQGRLFGDEPDDAPLPKGEDYSQSTLDHMMEEAIGCELGPHPAAGHEARILEFASGDLATCKTKNGDIIIGGVARNVQPRTIAGKRPGEPNRVMLTFDFDDMSGSTNVVAWPDHARAVAVKDGWVGLLAGRFERGKYTQFVAERAWPIEDAESAFAKAVVVEMVSAEHGPAVPDRLKRVMAAHPGPTPLYFKIWDGERWNWLECGKRFRVRASRRLVEELEQVAGEGSASTTAHAPRSRKE